VTAALPQRVAIVGPTASGKSAVAMSVAEQLGDVELISVDSMQVYRGMDIGTAKPSGDELRRVPHHLIDVVEPRDEFTVADFQRAYVATLTDLADRGVRALLVGGTGLYHRAVIDDLDIPGQWPEIRARLQAEMADSGPHEMFARLEAADPEAAARVEPSNERRIVRALEVVEGSGRKFSEFGPGLDTYPPTEVAQIGLRWDRGVLTDRIAARVRQMVTEGLVDEVRRIADHPGFSRTAAQALGYKEVLAHLRGEMSLDEAVDVVTTRTRQFAVRQERWFRRDPRVQWVDIVADPVAEVVPVVIAAFAANGSGQT
jgi:tRNA dimethylallyltransferase